MKNFFRLWEKFLTECTIRVLNCHLIIIDITCRVYDRYRLKVASIRKRKMIVPSYSDNVHAPITDRWSDEGTNCVHYELNYFSGLIV